LNFFNKSPPAYFNASSFIDGIVLFPWAIVSAFVAKEHLCAGIDALGRSLSLRDKNLKLFLNNILVWGKRIGLLKLDERNENWEKGLKLIIEKKIFPMSQQSLKQ